MSEKAAYMVLDLETTGLDPEKDQILEIGAIAVDGQLNELSRFHTVVHFNPDNWQWSRIDEVVQKMHSENGLWEEAASASDEHLEESADWMLSDWLIVVAPSKVILMGDAVHFDLSFLKARMPLTALRLNYRIVDLGSVKRFLRLSVVNLPEEESYPHRGLKDCEIELDYFRKLRDLVHGLTIG